MNIVAVLAMHGAPPNDFPRREMGEFFSLHMQLERGTVVPERRSVLETRRAELEEKMCAWPRTAQSDPWDQVAARRADKVIVVTPMLTPGGEHAEIEIPAAIEQAQQQHPDIEFRYAWPFDIDEVAQFLSTQALRHV